MANQDFLIRQIFGLCYNELKDPERAADDVRQRLAGQIPDEELEPLLAELVRQKHEKARRTYNLNYVHGIRAPGRVPWYPGPDEFLAEGFWKNLRDHLEHRESWDAERLLDLERSSTAIVAELANPTTSPFSSRGMVVGHIQSGKTASMSGVIAMAVDAGYEVVIVLSGLTNALRKQTQARLEGELCRSSSKISERWRTWTTDERDFNRQRADPNHDFGPFEKRRHLAVIKKNVSPLKQLITLLKEIPTHHLANRRFLIIDDECDQAGVNAAAGQQDSFDPDNPEETSRTAINRILTELLALPTCTSYVGYTATPYANVLINPMDNGDIFPRDFIKLLDPPPIYYGMERLFGRDPSSADDDGVTGIDAVRTIPEEDVSLIRPASRSGTGWSPSKLPGSLEDAFDHFLMTTAARRLRGEDEAQDHSTMLVHTTHLVDPQMAMAEAIRTRLVADRRSRIRTNDDVFRKRLGRLWKTESNRVPREPGVPRVDFDEIWDEFSFFIDKVTVIEEHGRSNQRIDFDSGALYAVIVGGNILSRGLTIEGLCVSYFVRPTKMYDSLSQMGRWFGYRIGYEDLVRIWMDGDLADAYRAIARVDFELRSDIRRLADLEESPEGLPPRIRSHPTLKVTAKAKMQWAIEAVPDFEGKHWETTAFPDGQRSEDQRWLESTLTATADWIDGVHGRHPFEERPDGRWLASAVPIGDVVDLLRRYERDTDQFPNGALIRFLEEIQRNRPESPCMTWNVLIDGRGDGRPAERVAFGQAITIRPRERSRSLVHASRGGDQGREQAASAPEFTIKHLFGILDLARDFPDGTVPPDPKRHQLLSLRGERPGCVVRRPLLTIARISKDSQPKDPTSKTQAPLKATHDLIGLGLVFPSTSHSGSYIQAAATDLDER